MVKLCLQQTPRLRPTCAELLTKASSQIPATLAGIEPNPDTGLIGTIKVPRLLHQITERLPEANYEDRNAKVRMNRNVSLPNLKDMAPAPSDRRHQYAAANKLSVIAESREDNVRSADLRRTRTNE